MSEAQYTVVIAEDEELLLTNLVNKIETLDVGFTVSGKSQTGVQALDLIKVLKPDLLITDIRMPLMDGLELIKEVKEHFPLTQFIITSGFSDFEYAKAGITLGVSDYLLKPVDPEELKKSLLKIKTKLHAEQQNYESIFNPAATRNSPAAIAELLKNYFVENFNQDINLNLIAQNMNYSSSYLTKIFCQQYDCTPSKYLISLRIQKAQQLLSHHPEYSIRQVGEAVGYEDQGYFSRIFKKQTGQSPFEYRETRQNLTNNVTTV